MLTGEEVRKLSDPFLAPVKTPVRQWALAVERVRYVGEPVALVVAESRYIAEDAAELVEIDYEPLAAVIDPVAACQSDAPLLHPEAGPTKSRCATSLMAIRKAPSRAPIAASP